MAQLNFTKVGDEWISSTLPATQGKTLVVAHLNFSANNSRVIVEGTIDSAHGWDTKDTYLCDQCDEISIPNIPTGMSIRFRCAAQPTYACYIEND